MAWPFSSKAKRSGRRRNMRTDAVPRRGIGLGRLRPKRSGLTLGVGRFIALVLFTVGMTAAGIYQVYSHYQVVRMGYVLDQDLFDYRRRMERHKRLKLSIASYKHPSSVEVFASEELGMRTPAARDELIVPGPAAPLPNDDAASDEATAPPVPGAPGLDLQRRDEPADPRLEEVP